MSDLPVALADVRRAYRLLHAYQRRINDLFALIVDDFGERGLTFASWYAVGHQGPPQKGTPFFRERWAWDMLPGHALGAHLTGSAPEDRAVTVHVQALADTGYEAFDGVGEPDAARFVSETACRSVLRWSLRRDPAGVTEASAVEALRREHGERLVSAGEHRARVAGGEVAHWLWEVDLAELPHRDAVRSRVIRPTLAVLASP